MIFKTNNRKKPPGGCWQCDRTMGEWISADENGVSQEMEREREWERDEAKLRTHHFYKSPSMNPIPSCHLSIPREIPKRRQIKLRRISLIVSGKCVVPDSGQVRTAHPKSRHKSRQWNPPITRSGFLKKEHGTEYSGEAVGTLGIIIMIIERCTFANKKG